MTTFTFNGTASILTLSRLKQLSVRQRVNLALESNDHTTLLILTLDPSPDVRIAMLENKHLPVDFMALLAEDENPDVRYATAEAYNCPLDLLLMLSADENPYVAHRAKKTISKLEAGIAA